jgi:hypothetical protein
MQSTFQRSFAGGELSPSLAARADQAKYLSGLGTCRNFVVLRNGSVANRSGTRFIAETKNSSTATFLFRYVSEVAGDSVLLEAGPNYIRPIKNGALVTLTGVPAYNGGTAYAIGDIASSGGVNYYSMVAQTGVAPPGGTWYAMPGAILEIPTPFGGGEFNWVQSGNVITLTSKTGVGPPYELTYRSITNWALQVVSTAPTIDPPTAVGSLAGIAGGLTYRYIVTAARGETYEESVGSAASTLAGCGEPTTAAPHTITWTPPAGSVAEYYIYKDPYNNGTYGFIGTATGQASFKDIGFVPDFGVTPPLARVLFNASGDYPKRAAYYQQRRFFANTVNNPDAIWGSRVGFTSNFAISSPLQDDDAINFRIAGNQHNPVRHLIGLKTLIAMTDGGEWTVGQSKQPLTPQNLPADQETYSGANDTDPAIIGNSVVYVQARGSIVRDIRFELEVEGLAGRDLTIFANHLFDGYTIDALDYQQTPDSIVWCVRSDGTLLGMTYLREQDIWGWHRHDSGAAALFEDVCVVPEPGEDAVYVLVRRTIDGVFKRYIERLESRQIQTLAADGFFVDAGLTYSGTPATSISGLSHLVGEVISVVGDGVVINDGDPDGVNAALFTVLPGGTINATLPASSIIHAGLPIRYAELELLDLDVAGLQTQIRDKKKRVNFATLLLEKTCRTFYAGPSASRMYQVKLDPAESNQAGVLFTGQETISLDADYNDTGRVFIRMTDPLPISVLGILPYTEFGG